VTVAATRIDIILPAESDTGNATISCINYD